VSLCGRTGTYRASAWLYAPTGGFDVNLSIAFLRTNGTVSTNSGSSFTTMASGVWTRHTVELAAPSDASKVSVRPIIQESSPSVSDVLYVDEVEVGRQGGALPTSGVFPVDFMIGGELVTVSAIGAMTDGIQTLTVTRSVNGIVKSHPAGTDVVLHPLPRLGLGN
jgi:hypothetical protein